MPRKECAPELVAKARHLYEQTDAPVDDIAAMIGLTRSPFYHRVREWGWRPRRTNAGTFKFARALTQSLPGGADAAPAPAAPAVPVSAAQRAALAQRVFLLAEREMDAVERVLKAATPADPGEAERSSRTLASVARTLREITALNHSTEPPPPPDDSDDDAVPRDLDAFREDLARRLHALIDSCAADEGAGGEPVPGEPAAKAG